MTYPYPSTNTINFTLQGRVTLQGRRFTFKKGSSPFKKGNVPFKKGNLPFTKGSLPFKKCDLPFNKSLKKGDLPWNCETWSTLQEGQFTIKLLKNKFKKGDLLFYKHNIPFIKGNLPFKRGDWPSIKAIYLEESHCTLQQRPFLPFQNSDLLFKKGNWPSNKSKTAFKKGNSQCNFNIRLHTEFAFWLVFSRPEWWKFTL